MTDRISEQVAALARRIAGRPAEPTPATELPPGTGHALAELRAAAPRPVRVDAHLTGAHTPDAAVTFTVEPIERRPFVPLHVREWRRVVDRMVADLGEQAPDDSPFGVLLAANTLQLAIRALRLAAEQVQPYRDPRTHRVVGTVEPDQLVYLHALIGDMHSALAAVAAATQQQLVDAYHAAQGGDIVGPPATDPAVEVAAVMSMMLSVEHDATAGARDCSIASERLGRLTRPDQPDQ